jgi:tRNA threonylcarbamoyladenosine biosynthesis protein TsaB
LGIHPVDQEIAMRLFCLDTSTLAGSIALLEGEAVAAEVNVNLGRKHTERLLPGMDWMFQELSIEPREIEAIAVDIGPGSFTGLRVGLATAKGLAISLSAPIVGVSSLETLAWPLRFYPGKILALIDARKGQVFAGFFQGGDEFKPASEPAALDPGALLERINERTLVVGDGLAAYREVFAKVKDKILVAGFEFDQPRASVVGRLGLIRLARGESDDPDTLAPVYLRGSDAETPKNKTEAK